MAASSTAAVLRKNLSELGLVRVLARHDVSPTIVKRLSPEDAARLLQRRLSPGPVKFAKKAYPSYRKRTVKKAAKNSRRSAKRPPNYRKRVWHELHVVICTDDKRYAKGARERKQNDANGDSGKYQRGHWLVYRSLGNRYRTVRDARIDGVPTGE
jgi:hypothetical protein